MSFIQPHAIVDEVYSEDGSASIARATLAYVHPASAESVRNVVNADPTSPDGRSQWVWLRLANGDLILGMFPQGDTYIDCELDAAYPHEGLHRKVEAA